jgi:hypothetical protein
MQNVTSTAPPEPKVESVLLDHVLVHKDYLRTLEEVAQLVAQSYNMPGVLGKMPTHLGFSVSYEHELRDRLLRLLAHAP